MKHAVVSKTFRLPSGSLLLMLLLSLGLGVACAGPCSLSDLAFDKTDIFMSSCGLTTFNTTELTRFTSLQRLYLSNNDFTTFPNVSAVGNTLSTLWLSNNQITDIGDDVIIHLKALRVLILSNNRFTTFPNVSALGNKLTSLSLSDNQITHISKDILVHLKTLQVLNLSHNRLTTFPVGFTPDNELSNLNLRDNMLSEVSDDAFLTMVKLKYLFLYNNPNLTRFPHPVQGLRNLERLYISDTGISDLPSILLQNVADLDLEIQRSVDVCLCENAWLKQEGPNMAYFDYDDADCDGQLWSTMTVQDMIAKCSKERQQKDKQVTRGKAVSAQTALSPFLLHSFQGGLRESCCTIKCIATPGCVSFYWHHSGSGVGDCALIAPGNSINVSSVPEGNLPVWTYVALT